MVQTFATQAALYRLTGDRHHIHIDPEASARIGQPTPILQGCAPSPRPRSRSPPSRARHPADLIALQGRFSGPVIPGDALDLESWPDGAFELRRDGVSVISDGRAVFA